MTVRIGTRGSALARAQAAIVLAALGAAAEMVVIRTAGDASDRPMRELEDGAFVIAIEEALRRGEIDVAVHSLKDLPTEERPGLVLAAILKREDPRDVLITRPRGGLDTLPAGAVVGTSSPRRDAFLRALRPDIATRPIRGNVDTRMAKVARGEYDATVLALAGLRRLGTAVHESEVLDPRDCPPAPGQGALAVQCRADDARTRALVAPLDHPDTRRAVEAERTVLGLLGASCEIPLGTWGRVEHGEVVVDAALAAGGGIVRARASGADGLAVARACADELGASVHRRAADRVTVILTRAREDNAALAADLRRSGVTVLEAPCVRTMPLAGASELARAVGTLRPIDLIVITSRAGADAVARVRPRDGLACDVAAIGEATAARARTRGLHVAFVASHPDGATLARELPLPAGDVVLARSDIADDRLPAALRARGARVRTVTAYRTVPSFDGDVAGIRDAIEHGPAVVVLASPSAVDAIADAIDAAVLRRARLVAIGERTAARIRERVGRTARVAGAPVTAIRAAVKREMSVR